MQFLVVFPDKLRIYALDGTALKEGRIKKENQSNEEQDVISFRQLHRGANDLLHAH